MPEPTRSEAVRTAGDRLEAIETWTRRTFIACVVAAAFLGVIATAILYVGYDYVRLKWAASDAAQEFRSKAAGRARPAPARTPKGGE
jgi:hypothetical protein